MAGIKVIRGPSLPKTILETLLAVCLTSQQQRAMLSLWYDSSLWYVPSLKKPSQPPDGKLTALDFSHVERSVCQKTCSDYTYASPTHKPLAILHVWRLIETCIIYQHSIPHDYASNKGINFTATKLWQWAHDHRPCIKPPGNDRPDEWQNICV